MASNFVIYSTDQSYPAGSCRRRIPYMSVGKFQKKMTEVIHSTVTIQMNIVKGEWYKFCIRVLYIWCDGSKQNHTRQGVIILMAAIFFLFCPLNNLTLL